MLKKILIVVSVLVIGSVLSGAVFIGKEFYNDFTQKVADAETENATLKRELNKLKAEHYKAAEYDSVYSRIDRMTRKGYLPDTLVLWCIRRAWNEAGLSDSVGLSWSEIESGVGAYDKNILGEKGIFFLAEDFLRDLTLMLGGDTVGFVFKDYQHPYLQSKWAAFAELAIRIKLGGKGSYWAYNTGALMFGRSDFDKLMDEFVKWRATQYMNSKKNKR